MSRVPGAERAQAGVGQLERISFQTLEIWNIERAGNIKSIELIAIFNVQGRDNRIVYHLYDSKNNVISEGYPRIYNKGESLYPKFFETQTPDGIVRMEAYLVDANNHRISNIPIETLYLKKAQPASGIGQRALEDPQFNLPEFPEAIREASSTAQNPELISAKVERDRLAVYVSPEEARAAVTITEPAAVTITEPAPLEISILPEVYAEEEVINTQVSTNMITQELLNFTIVNNRIQGSIKFIATDAFNPYYYNKEIMNHLELISNNKTIHIKTNRLRFTKTERDELINFDEQAYDLNTINAISYVWNQSDIAMSNILQFTIETGKETTVTPGKGGLMGAGVLGVIGILMLGGFIADHMRKRK